MLSIKPLVVLASLAAAPAVRADAVDLKPRPRFEIGIEVGPVPAVLSAIDGHLGGALQLWAGRGVDRLRVVAAHTEFPDALTGAPFRDRKLTVLGLDYDRFFRDGFRGPWVGGGLELWRNELGSERGPDTEARTSAAATFGGGWVFPVWRSLYVNPWAAAHVPLGNQRIHLYGSRHDPDPILREFSVKVGWAFAP